MIPVPIGVEIHLGVLSFLISAETTLVKSEELEVQQTSDALDSFTSFDTCQSKSTGHPVDRSSSQGTTAGMGRSTQSWYFPGKLKMVLMS